MMLGAKKVRKVLQSLSLALAACACAFAASVGFAYADDAVLLINEDTNSFGYVEVTATSSPVNAFAKYVSSSMGLYAGYLYKDGEDDSWHFKQKGSVKSVASNFTYAMTLTSEEEMLGKSGTRQWKCAVYSAKAAKNVTVSSTPLSEKIFSVAKRSVSVSGTMGIKGSSLDLQAVLSPEEIEASFYTWQRKASGSSSWETVAKTENGHCSLTLDDEALSSTWRCVVTAADGVTTGTSKTFSLALLTPSVTGTAGCYNGVAEATATMPRGVSADSWEWQYRVSESAQWQTVDGESNSSASLPVNDKTLTYEWRVLAKVGEDTYESETFSLSYDSFAVDCTDTAKGVSGTLIYEIISWPQGSTPGEARLKDGSSYEQSESSPALEVGSVTSNIEGSTYTFAVTSVESEAFKGNGSLYRVSFSNNLTGTATGLDSCALGTESFSGCANLRSVSFTCSTVNAIGDSAFSGCTSLEEVTFADGLKITSGIWRRAFEGCSALKSIQIPVITCAQRFPDYYSWYGLTQHDIEDAALSTYDQWHHMSGYQSYWHSNAFAVFSSALSYSVFRGCTSLETIDFKAGSDQGLFAYFGVYGCGLDVLPNLKSVVYEASQPYYSDPNRSLVYGSYKSLWGQTDEDTGVTGNVPALYYAVDFYVTEAKANSADNAGSSRYARVEYRRGTPTSLIQSCSSEVASYEYADSSLYQSKESDGTTPNPKAVAVANGLDSEDSATQWVWHLTDTQSRREGLTDSCKAYLVKVSDLSAGRLGTDGTDADQMGTMYELCDQNMSQGSIQDSAFDYERYYGKVSPVDSRESVYAFSDSQSLRGLSIEEGKTAWFNIGCTKKSFLSQLTFYDGAGNSFNLGDTDSLSVTFQQYNENSGTLEIVTYAHLVEGPVLLTVAPKGGDNYDSSTCLQEWVLVKPQAVTELLTATAGETATSAQHINADGTQTETFAEDAFTVNVSSTDYLSALLAISYSGLSRGSLAVTSSEDEYGFQIDSQGIKTNFSLKDKLDSGGTVSGFAVACLDDYAYQKSINNISCENEWGDTAVLVNPSYVTEVATAAAAYSYAKSAPILYTEDDGSLSDDVVECLKGFKNVVVIGGVAMVSDESLQPLISALGSNAVTRVAGADGDTDGNACSLSVAVAELLTSGDNASNTLENVAIVLGDGADMTVDVAGALNFSGHRNGVTLAVSSTADAKRVAQYLKNSDGTIVTIRVFGRTVESSTSAGYSDVESVLTDCLAGVQDPDAVIMPVIGTGDTFEIDGVMFSTDAAGNLTALSDETGDVSVARKWNTLEVCAGTYDYDGATYTLATAYAEATKTLRVPVAVEGLTYTGAELTGLTGMISRSAYDIEGGSATAAGDYVAAVKPKKGYTWKDGSSDVKTVSWSIGRATLGGGSVSLEYSTHEYTGSALTPAVTVKLRDGSVIPSDDYEVTYADNTAVGNATITVKANGINVGDDYDLTATFVITKKEDKGSSDDDSKGSSEDTDKSGSGSKTNTDGDSSSGDFDDDSSWDSDDSSDSATTSAGTSHSNVTVSLGSSQSDSGLVDGWKTFYAPGNDDDAFVSTEGVSSSGASPIGVSGIAVCCLAFCGAVAYSSRLRKETNDIIDEESSSKGHSVD